MEDEEIDDTDAMEQEPNANETLATSPDATATAAKPSLRGRFKMIFGNRLINCICR